MESPWQKKGKSSGSADAHFREARFKCNEHPGIAADRVVPVGAGQDAITGPFEEAPEERTAVWGGGKERNKILVDKLKGAYIRFNL